MYYGKLQICVFMYFDTEMQHSFENNENMQEKYEHKVYGTKTGER